jgi:hypothetical protein
MSKKEEEKVWKKDLIEFTRERHNLLRERSDNSEFWDSKARK